jgi:hypothetical protein
MIRLRYIFGKVLGVRVERTARLDAVKTMKIPDMSRNRLELPDTLITLPRSITVT